MLFQKLKLQKVSSGFQSFVQKLSVTLLLVFGAGNSYAGDIDNGGRLYAKHCAKCHGVNGVSVMPDAPNFARSENLLRPDVFILASIREGNNAMPSFQGILKDTDMLDVISYLRTLEQFGPTNP
ncbi:MAG: cytochrome c [Gallionella sp.]